MTFKELASKITGITFPLFGVSWQPAQSDIEIAKKIINFLEDRRVLYNAYQLEDPKHCYESVIEIRGFLTEQVNHTTRDSELDSIIRGMRAACRKALDHPTHGGSVEDLGGHRFGYLDQIQFFSAIGVLRGTMGVLIAKIAIMYGIDCEEDLLSIIPSDTEME
jgi:hypothetical protein